MSEKAVPPPQLTPEQIAEATKIIDNFATGDLLQKAFDVSNDSEVFLIARRTQLQEMINSTHPDIICTVLVGVIGRLEGQRIRLLIELKRMYREQTTEVSAK